MSSHTAPDFAPQQNLSIVGAFKAAPTLVKALIGCLYARALLVLGGYVADMLSLGDTFDTITDSSNTPALADASPSLGLVAILVGVGFALVVGLITFLLGKGLARGARSMWLLTLVLTVVIFAFAVISVLAAATVGSILNVVITVAMLALLLTPVVRQHCTKK